MTRRYPFAALAAAMGATPGAAARQLGLSGTTWKTYRDTGVTEVVGDRLACKAGLNPYEVWPAMLDDIIADVGTGWTPKRREQQRRKYANDAAERTRRRQIAANYYAENGDYVRARNRRHYAANAERIAAKERERYRANATQIAERRKARRAAQRQEEAA